MPPYQIFSYYLRSFFISIVGFNEYTTFSAIENHKMKKKKKESIFPGVTRRPTKQMPNEVNKNNKRMWLTLDLETMNS